MRHLAFLKSLRLPLLLGIPILAVLLALWLAQQNNVNSLAQQIDALRHQIDALPATVTPKDKLALQKDRLTLEKDRVNAQNAIYGTLVQALGGAFFVVTAYFTHRNVRATEANVRAAEEKQVTERFSKAIELLGNEKLEVRLGGIYALERIAKDSPKDHWTIMEVLTSFVQEKSPLQMPKSTQDEKTTLVEPNSREQSGSSLQKISTEVQAALTVVGRRDPDKDQKSQYIKLSSTNLSGANLSYAKLSYANLSGANLRRANLSEASLSGANLRGADFRGANLSRANLSEAKFFEANLRGAKFFEANLSEANLIVANLSEAKFFEANLRGANLFEANLSGANLSGAISLTQEQINVANTDETTELPDYLQSPKSSKPETSSQSEPPPQQT